MNTKDKMLKAIGIMIILSILAAIYLDYRRSIPPRDDNWIIVKAKSPRALSPSTCRYELEFGGILSPDNTPSYKRFYVIDSCDSFTKGQILTFK